MKHLLKSNFVVLLLVMLLASCAGMQGTREEQAGKAMLMGQETIVQLATTADQLCTAGVLTQGQCDDIRTAYEFAKVYYDLAETALATALKVETEDAWARYTAVHNQFDKAYADLLAVAMQHGVKVEGVIE